MTCPVRFLLLFGLATGCLFSSCRRADRAPVDHNPVIIEVASSQIKLDAYQFYLECNYPEILGQLDDEMHSFIFSKFKRDLFLAEISQTLVRISDEQVEDFIRKNESIFRTRAGVQGFYALPETQQMLWRNEIRRRLAIQQFLKREIIDSTTISDQSIARYYEQNQALFEKDTRFRLRFVQIVSEEKAERFRAELRKSKEPFLKVAANYAANEGYLLAQPMLLSDLPESFRDEVSKLSPGQCTKVIPIDYGEMANYYVIYLESFLEQDAVPFEEADGIIREKLEKQHYDRLLDDKIQQFEHRVPIKVFTEALPFKLIDPPPNREV